MSRRIRWTALCLCVCWLLTLCGCGAAGPSSSAVGSAASSDSSAAVQPQDASGPSEPVEPEGPVRPEKPFGFDRLDPEQQEMYRLLESGTITEENPYLFPAGADEEHPMLVAMMLYDLNHRTLIWREPAYFRNYNEAGTVLEKVVSFIGFDNHGNDAVMRERFDAASAEWLSLLPGPEADDYTKIKAIAELLCERVTYNYAAAYGYGYDALSAEEREVCRYTHTEYGALVNGSAVCTGYAAAFEYLCDQLGVYCLQVRGDAGRNQSMGHVWNLVWLDGAYYHVDTTWMDNDRGVWDYTYLLASEAQLWSDHYDPHFSDQLGLEDNPSWRRVLRLPDADCDDGGYFDREGLRFETAEQAIAYLEQEMAVDQALQVQLTSEQAYFRTLHLIERINLPYGEDNNLAVSLTQENPSARTLRVEGFLYW